MSDKDYMYWGPEAERAFEHVHQRARIESFLRKLTGRRLHLLSFREVQERLQLHLSRELGVREISLDKIVGSVGKPDAFTPTFLPRYAHLKERWKRVYAGAQSMLGLPPIEVYQVGDVYFIKDGHHRVSVARHLGATTMTADVTEYIVNTQQPEGSQIEELVGAEQGAH
jgi:hypothetical protein